MALTTTVQKRTVYGDTHAVFVDLAPDDSYVLGGYALAPEDLGFSDALTIQFVAAQPAGGYQVDYDSETGKLVYYSAARTEVSAAADLSDAVSRALVVLSA